jgi:inner membrane protein
VLWTLAGIGAFAWIGYLLWSALALLAALALALAWLHRRGPRAGLAAGMAAALAFVTIQAGGAAAARGQFAAERSGAAPLDLALTAYPANPLCWSFVAVERRGAVARLTGGVVSAAPALLPVTRCPAAVQPAVQHSAADARALTVLWEHDSSLAVLRGQAASDCRFAAWLGFARMPALFDGAALDARFGIAPGANFSTLRYAAGAARPCPANLPRWGMPRADLLR